jgi:hypothetical protein
MALKATSKILSSLYKNLSGYIHLSESHLFHPVQKVDNKTITYAIQAKDTKFPEFSWIEVIDYFNESIDIFTKYLKDWIFLSENSELIAQIKKRQANQTVKLTDRSAVVWASELPLCRTLGRHNDLAAQLTPPVAIKKHIATNNCILLTRWVIFKHKTNFFGR